MKPALCNQWEEKAAQVLAEATPTRVDTALVVAKLEASPVADLFTSQPCRMEGTDAFRQFKTTTMKEFPQVVAIDQFGDSRIRLWTKEPNIFRRVLHVF